MGFVQLCHLLFQLLRLRGGKLEVTEVTTAMFFRIIVPKLSLQRVRSQDGVRHERARQAARGNVLPELKAQEVSEEQGGEKGRETSVRAAALSAPEVSGSSENRRYRRLFAATAETVFSKEVPPASAGS